MSRTACGSACSRAWSFGLTRVCLRQFHAPSISTRRARQLPALAVPPRRRLAPLECSEGASRQLLCQRADRIGPVRHRSPVADLTAALALRSCGRDRRLMDIQPDEPAVLHPVSAPVLRLGTRQPGATPERRMPQERPLPRSVHTAIMGSEGSAPLLFGRSFSGPRHGRPERRGCGRDRVWTDRAATRRWPSG